ncbi:hypothetical protein [Secundilactobacillus similis]|uniref:Uncharacterized protein n=1 Tax=Secundilactobacillus similis DSM 23365 = JCM 2765 TaxID=1423804 RepID=A0A0R2FG76_9LACO|nr:hypothetical protein [Secundilactobacillus similis]KRN23836.1 hypothetical protein FD14_GL000589 [Secundilactobacillus similis DSM 23365 = JCM 2765]
MSKQDQKSLSIAETQIQAKLATLIDNPVSAWFKPLADVFTTGMAEGLQSAYIIYTAESQNKHIRDLGADVYEKATTWGSPFFKALLQLLNDPKSADFHELDDRLHQQLIRTNELHSFEEIQTLPVPQLYRSDLLDIYFFGWEFGFRYAYWMLLRQPNPDDSQNEALLETAKVRATKEAQRQRSLADQLPALRDGVYAKLLGGVFA